MTVRRPLVIGSTGRPAEIPTGDTLPVAIIPQGSGSTLDADLLRGVTPGATGLSLVTLGAVAAGSLFYTSALSTVAALAPGTDAHVLTMVAGSPAWAVAASGQPLDDDLTAIAALASTGLLARTGSNTWAQRTLTGTANEITATNGDGVSGNPTLSLPAALTFTGKTVTGGTFTGLDAVDVASIGGTTPGVGVFTTLGATDVQAITLQDAGGPSGASPGWYFARSTTQLTLSSDNGTLSRTWLTGDHDTGVLNITGVQMALAGSLGLDYAQTATSAGTLTLTATSKPVQVFTGVTTHTCVLPQASAFAGASPQVLLIKNRSTGAVTVSRGGTNTIDGSASSVVLAANESAMFVSNANTDWNRMLASSAGGSDTQVQFNDGGALGGDAGLVYNKTTDALTILGSATVKPATTAGLKLDPNAATGNFTLSLSPANITADRRATFPDATITVAGINLTQTFSATQTFAAIDATSVGATTAGTGKFTTMTVTGLTSGRIPLVSTAGLLTDFGFFTYANSGLSIKVGSSAGSGTFTIDGVAGNARTFAIQTAGVNRWTWIVGPGSETGSDAGSALGLEAYTDAGASAGVVMSVVRASGGAVSFVRPVSCVSTLAVTGVATASNIKRGTGSPEGVTTGAIGDLFQRTDGTTDTAVYKKETGAGNTGWVAIAAGSSGGITQGKAVALILNAALP